MTLSKDKFVSLLTAAILLWTIGNTDCPAQTNVIFDTDIGSDCDDAGAMAVLHKLADKGEINILGVIFSSEKNKFGVGTCDAINTYYGRGNLPLGHAKGNEVGDSRNLYSQVIAEAKDEYGHRLVDSAAALLDVYKNILAGQPDSSVTIVSVGHPYGLYTLLRDAEGKELIGRKVSRWVVMTHTDTAPLQDWNFGKNGAAPYVKYLLGNWPGKIFFSGAGKTILTGHKKLPFSPDPNPVKKAYEIWRFNALVRGRSSWDQIAVLFAARPGYFHVDARGSLVQNEQYETYWDVASDRANHYRITPALDDREMENMIEDLMSEQPSAKR
ncbi:hypothetical protein GCM10023091_06350 [Ravibacter arvi]|uniref:Nucleoside hydrolase n=1 Tax=Ravibacter arvi TaxID=2051041 RepID=A0ABP8LNM1_9BACT